MDRLTKFDSNGVPTIPPENASLAVGKLWNLENAEEQGRLIELPFSYGDTIYEVYESEHKIIEWTVTGFSVTPGSMYISIGKFGLSLNAEKLGDTVFCTKAEAEAKLKELIDQDGKK